MSSNVDSEPNAPAETSDSLGVRFAESSVGEPVVEGLLFVTSSSWLMITAVGVLLALVAWALNDGVMAGIIGVFGLSGVFVGTAGYAILRAYVRYQERKY